MWGRDEPRLRDPRVFLEAKVKFGKIANVRAYLVRAQEGSFEYL